MQDFLAAGRAYKGSTLTSADDRIVRDDIPGEPWQLPCRKTADRTLERSFDSTVP